MWRINQNQASVNASGLSARVNLQQPHSGLVDVVWHGTSWPHSRLFQVRPPRSGSRYDLLDAYVRGRDLVACYRTPSHESLAIQVYWRFIAHPDLDAAGVELIVSVQTELLDDDPCLTVGSELSCCDVLQAGVPITAAFTRVSPVERASSEPCRGTGTGLFLYRLDAERGGYLEMVHPADFFRADFERGSEPDVLRSRFELFEERLEKGVLRRARASGLLLRRGQDAESVAWECYRRWLVSAAPLTA
jgi:hypothetical protein